MFAFWSDTLLPLVLVSMHLTHGSIPFRLMNSCNRVNRYIHTVGEQLLSFSLGDFPSCSLEIFPPFPLCHIVQAWTVKVLEDALRLLILFAEKQMSVRSNKNDYCPKEESAAIEATRTIKVLARHNCCRQYACARKPIDLRLQIVSKQSNESACMSFSV